LIHSSEQSTWPCTHASLEATLHLFAAEQLPAGQVLDHVAQLGLKSRGRRAQRHGAGADRALSVEHPRNIAGAEAVVDLANTTDVVELDRKGAELFGRIVDGAVDCPTGLGLRTQTINLAVEASMDPASFPRQARGGRGEPPLAGS
jgi:hypothetical protein